MINNQKVYLGLDLGGTKIHGGIVTENGDLINSLIADTNATKGKKYVLEKMSLLLENLLYESDINIENVSGLGICVPGAINQNNGTIFFLTNLSGWNDFPLKQFYENKYKIPVFINNDANAASLGEYYFGNGAGCKDMIYITVSTGIGGGIIINNKLINGINGTAGEIGHMVLEPAGAKCNCGNNGCWEAISSGTAIVKEFARRIKAGEESILNHLILDEISAKEIFQAREQGDKISIEVTDRAIEYIGIGVANLVNILNPQKVVIGGGISQVGSILFEPVNKIVTELAYGPANKVEIIPAKLGKNTGVIGAAALAMAKMSPHVLA